MDLMHLREFKMTHFILVDSTKSGPGPALFKKVQEYNLIPVILTKNPEEFDWLSGDHVIIDIDYHADSMYKRIRNSLPHCLISGITTTKDECISLACELADKFGLPSPNKHSISICSNKISQKQNFEKHGIPSSRFSTLPAFLNQENDWQDLWQFPVILKPLQGVSSSGLFICHNKERLVEICNSTKISTSNYLIEEYVDGPEYSAELFDGNFIGLIEKRLSSIVDFSEEGYIANPVIDPDTLKKVINVTQTLCRKMELSWGPIHIDLRINKHDVKIIEVNPRIAGSFICEMIGDCYNFSIVESLLRKSISEKVDCQSDSNTGISAVVDFVFLPTNSLITKLFNHECFTGLEHDCINLRLGERKWDPKKRVSYIYSTFPKKKLTGYHDNDC